MKKLAIILAIGLAGCNPNLPCMPTRINLKLYDIEAMYYVKVFEIDSCQYVSYGESVIHKGDCSNPIHNNQTTQGYGK